MEGIVMDADQKQIAKQFREERIKKQSIQNIDPSVITDQGVSTLVKYFLEVLDDISLPFTCRKAFISKYRISEAYRNQFNTKHHISESQENEYYTEVLLYLTNIRLDIQKRLQTLSVQDRALLMSDDEKTNNFLSKYIPSDEEIRKDKFV